MDLARIAGFLYLGASILFVAAGTIRGRIIVVDPAATIQNVRASDALVRLGMATDVAAGTLFLLTALALYALLRDTQRLAAAAMVVFAAIGMTLGSVAVAQELALVSVATQTRADGVLGDDAVRQLVVLAAASQQATIVLTDLTSGLWLLPLGYLVMRSRWLPAAVGALLIVGGCAWIARLFVRLLAPELSGLVATLALGSIGEVVLIGWLLVKGRSTETARP